MTLWRWGQYIRYARSAMKRQLRRCPQTKNRGAPMTPDIINASFEFIAAFMLARNCWFTYKAKGTKGISIASSVFFALWGYWNIFYYPHLGQMISFYAGIMVTAINSVWVIQMIYYRSKQVLA